MSWAKVCDTLHGHPKALDAGLEPMGLWVLSLSHCASYLTNGHVKRSTALRIAGSDDRTDGLAERLVSAGLWEPHASGDGWQIHDYLLFNPDRETVLRERERGKARAAASYGRKSSGEEPAKQPRRSAGSSAVLHGPDPDPDPVPKTPSGSSLSPGLESASARTVRKDRRKQETAAPTSDAPTTDVEAWLARWEIPATAEATRFLNHARSVDRRCRDWTAAWRNWLSRAADFGPRKVPAQVGPYLIEEQ